VACFHPVADPATLDCCHSRPTTTQAIGSFLKAAGLAPADVLKNEALCDVSGWAWFQTGCMCGVPAALNGAPSPSNQYVNVRLLA
jgi:hypothetical protein